MNSNFSNTVELNRRILVVDDNPAIHEDIRKVLGRSSKPPSSLSTRETQLFGPDISITSPMPFELAFADQGEEALAKVETAQSAGQPFALAFVDVRMPPGWDGIETIFRLWKVSPELQVVICTAYSDYSWSALTQRLGESDNLLILKKPFDNIEVVQLAHALTRKWMLNRQAALRLEDLDRVVTLRTAELKQTNEQLVQEISDRKRIEQQLLQAQRLEAVGHLAGGLAHELNNQHAVIQGFAELCQRDIRNDQIRLKEAISEILGASHRVTNLTSELLAFSRQQMIHPRFIDLNALLASLRPTLEALVTVKVCLSIEPMPGLPRVWADDNALARVICNLASNARDAMPAGGAVTVRTSQVLDLAPQPGTTESDSSSPCVCLEVTDTNPNAELKTLERTFDPFSCAKDLAEGTGLRLASVYGLVMQHEGSIEVVSDPGRGTTFRIYWPTSPAR